MRFILLYTRKQWGQNARDAYEEALNQALMTLRDNPSIGRSLEGIAVGLRFFRVRQHVIYYRFGDDIVTVFRVLHGKMDASQHLGER